MHNINNKKESIYSMIEYRLEYKDEKLKTIYFI